mmetsp:Transcript_1715/g.4847  ORF Transcript_1715/g.4847 Transcript_1715/m.4847 type:complete len:90 (+) Transcript_1715:80-349(+)
MPPQPGTRALMKLAKLGGEALKPQKVDGRWRKAAISAKNQARLRKTALMEGTFGKFDPATGTPTLILTPSLRLSLSLTLTLTLNPIPNP